MATSLPQVCRVSINGTFDSRPWTNVLHFLHSGGLAFTATSIDGLLALLGGIASVNTSWQHVHQTMDTGSNINSLVGRSLDNTSPIERSLNVNIAGTSTGNNMPPMTSAVIRWTTAFASRSSRGRTYLPGLNVGFVLNTDADRLDPTVAGNLQTRATDFLTAWNGSSAHGLIVLSAKNRALNAVAPYNLVTGASVFSLIAVQRRRRG